jgi:hypothetical protein
MSVFQLEEKAKNKTMMGDGFNHDYHIPPSMTKERISQLVAERSYAAV